MKAYIPLILVLSVLSVEGGLLHGKGQRYFRIVEEDSADEPTPSASTSSSIKTSSSKELPSPEAAAQTNFASFVRAPSSPEAAAQTNFASFARAPSSFNSAQRDQPPHPYEFEYAVEDAEGSHSRKESGDGSGKVTGSYGIKLANGLMRTVNYVADSGGYRASISTNEPGTESQDPADVQITSSAIPGPEAANQDNQPRQGISSFQSAPRAGNFLASASSSPATYLPVAAETTQPSRDLVPSASQRSTTSKPKKAIKYLLVPVEVDEFHDH